MRLLLRLSRGIDWINGQFGTIATWLVLIACLIAGAILGTLIGRDTTDEITAAIALA